MPAKESFVIVDVKKEVLGSVVRITVVVEPALKAEVQKAISLAFAECERLDKNYSRFRKNNKLSALNEKIDKWQKVDEEFFFLLEEGEKVFLKTDGAFNLGVKSLLEQWGYDQNYSFKPSSQKNILNEVSTLKNPPYQLGKDYSVKVFYPIELGGLGKGYALDLMVESLQNFSCFCIDAGGDLYAQGFPEKMDLAPNKSIDFEKIEDGVHQQKSWEIFFENPTDVTSVIGKVNVDGFFLASSNSLKRRWAKDYHHLADPRSQKPAEDMLGVYTQAKSGLLADAYSTALFVLGFDEAKKRVQDLPIEAMFISQHGKIYRTKNFKGELFVG